MMQLETGNLSLSTQERWRRNGIRLAWAGVAGCIVATGQGSNAAAWVALGCLVLITAGFWICGNPPGKARELLGPAAVTVDAGRLVITAGGKTLVDVPVENVQTGWFERTGVVAQRSNVKLALRDGRDVDVRVAGSAEGEQLLAALGLSAQGRVLRVPLNSYMLGVVHWELPAVVAVVVLGPFFLVASMVVSRVVWALLSGAPPHETGDHLLMATAAAIALGVIVLGSVRLLLRRYATVGTDGIVIEGGPRRVVIPLTDIADVSYERGVVVTRRSGQRVVLPTLAGSGALLHRLHQLTGQHADADVAALLDRGGRPIDEWTRELAALVEADADYRRRVVGRDALEAIACDGSAGAERRIGAMFALGRMDASDVVERAIASTADAELAGILRDAAAGKIDKRALTRVARRYRVAEGDEMAGSSPGG